MTAGEGSSSERIFWGAIAMNQLERYPLLEVRDLYKLAYQAALGSEHAVSDPAAARAWLEEEIDALGPGPPDPQFDPISPDGAVLRVHLRPFLAEGGDPERLLQAFLESANAHDGSLERLQIYWRWSIELAAQGFIPLEPGEMEAFFEAMRAESFPAVHHSQTFEQAYHPAYRVVLADIFP
jgi:hypothetical protein